MDETPGSYWIVATWSLVAWCVADVLLLAAVAALMQPATLDIPVGAWWLTTVIAAAVAALLHWKPAGAWRPVALAGLATAWLWLAASVFVTLAYLPRS